MPRVRWCSFPLTVLCVVSWTASASADCWYSDKMRPEGEEVPTAEPCLNCTCSRGTLLCYLRVCPRLPNPPPPGCILLHRYRTCCPELICTEIYGGGNSLEARSEPDGFDIPHDKTLLANACVANGSIYGPGSAMDSSSLCEYCYCLGGKQTCVTPKCLLPIKGCVPMYEPTTCCPVHYNCSQATIPSTTSTTTLKPKQSELDSGGCIIDGVFYKEGGKVLGVGHSVCDNCYCLRGILRCEPLSCAPPLLGCTPVVRPGECCAASYNCSGTIEIQPKPNIGQYPIVSKEYAKLRKEVQQKPTKHTNKNSNNNAITENSNAPFYVIAETSKMTTKTQRGPLTFGTTRHFTGTSFKPSTLKPIYHNSMIDNDSDNYATTRKPATDENARSTETNFGLTDETLLSIVDSLLDNRLNRRVDGKNETTTTTEDMETTTTTLDPITATTEETTTDTTMYDTSTVDLLTTTEELVTTNPVTLKTILNSTDCIDGQKRHDLLLLEPGDVTTVLPVDANEINKLEIVKELDDFITTSRESYTDTTTNDVTEVDLESRVKVSTATLRNIPKAALEIESILNITKNKEQDYEYDYNEPTLPPSLPNLRIIPFVAADALYLKKEKESPVYPGQKRVTDTSFGYANLFSPPVETEGGFIPKEPPILENFYENTVTVPTVVNTPKPNDGSCISEGREISHGEPVASDGACITCSCFYGNVVCQKVPCPVARPGCRKSPVADASLCCPLYVCDDEEAPTVVLDRLETKSSPQETAVTVAEGINTPDPFRDVIRTEPAPDLQSLIVDMMPFLARITTPLPITTTTTQETTTVQTKPPEIATKKEDLTLDKVLQLLFSNQDEAKSETTTQQIQTGKTADDFGVANSTTAASVEEKPSFEAETRESINETDHPNHGNSVDSPASGMALLKLAGCNIYGRMYRVGRIISELSNPCLECKCTEIGVQCRALKC